MDQGPDVPPAPKLSALERNVFEGILKNPYFCGIWGLTMVIQAAGVQLAGGLLAVHKDGITSWQWVVCVAFGAGELLWQKVINLVLHVSKERADGDDREGPSAFREAGLLKFGSGKIALAGSVRDNVRSSHNSSRSQRSSSSRRARQRKYAADDGRAAPPPPERPKSIVQRISKVFRGKRRDAVANPGAVNYGEY